MPRGGGGGGYSETEKIQFFVTKCQDLLKFNFRGGEGILKLKSDKVPRSA